MRVLQFNKKQFFSEKVKKSKKSIKEKQNAGQHKSTWEICFTEITPQ